MLCVKNFTTNETSYVFNSLAIYRDQFGNCTRVAGQFFNNHNYLIQGKNNFTYVSEGDICFGNQSYVITYAFINDPKISIPTVNYNIKIPHYSMIDDCTRKLEIKINFENYKEDLYIQKFFCDYYILTGILFIIIGVYLLIFAKYKKITKFIIGTTFGEIFIFAICTGFIYFQVDKLEWAFFIVGLAIGGFLGYFSLGGNRLYRVILALTAGFIFGLMVFDILFTHLCSRLSQVLLFDTLLIFMSLFVLIIYLQHSFHYFYDSIIGGYLFVRGFCLLIHKAGKYARYRELNILLYLLNKYEVELAKYFYEEKWPIYYVYTILMILVISGSIVYYFLKVYKRDLEDEIEKEENSQKEMLRNKSTSTTSQDDKELD